MANLLIFASARTGSNLLCNLLNKTGDFGLVEGFWVGFPDNIATSYLANMELYFEQHAGKHFAAKISWDYLNQISTFNKSFTNGYSAVMLLLNRMTHFINLERRDKIAQAVSWHVTATTKQWSTADQQRNHFPDYDFHQIAWYLANIQGFDARTREFARTSPTPFLHMVYEDYIQDFRASVSGIYDFIGDTMPEDYDAEPDLKKQASSLKDSYIDRFRSEYEQKEVGRDNANGRRVNRAVAEVTQ